jgi:hypothetical protein
MGLLEFFGVGGERNLRKHIARAKNKDAQSADRFASLEALATDGSAGAVEGLLGRFTMRYDKSIEDEQEKQWVFDQLCKKGSDILQPLQKHLLSAESISWGLKILHEVASEEDAWPVLERLCAQNDNSYTRDPSKKVQLLHYLGEQQDARACQALIPYLEDMDEGVRFTAVEALLQHKNAEISRESMLVLLVRPEEESRRIKVRIVEGFADLGWDVKGHSGKIEKLLETLLPGARIDNHGRIKRKIA